MYIFILKLIVKQLKYYFNLLTCLLKLHIFNIIIDKSFSLEIVLL